MAASAQDFRDQVWPLLRDDLGGGELVLVETVTNSPFASLLDRLGMTDAWQVVEGSGIRALATRVQWGWKDWGSWTIRTRLQSGGQTEWHKLTMLGDWHRPSYIIQAYLKQQGGPVISAACIRAIDMQLMLWNGWHGKEKPYGGNWFVPVWWDDAVARGFKVLRWPHESG
jgi:hypothetical protein